MPQKVGRVYGLYNDQDSLQYVGSTVAELSHRFSTHRARCRTDPSCCPLYRQCGGMDGWSIRQLLEMSFDPELTPNALKHAEDATIASMRARGEQLLNHNAAIDSNAARREYARRWRREHPGYMSDASRRHRELRRQMLLQRTADAGTVTLDAFAAA